MKDYIDTAYELGYTHAIQKSAASPYLQRDNINRMLLGTVIGGTSGALIGGRYNRTPGLIGGALAGAIAANPQLFLMLLNRGSKAVYDFTNGNTPGLKRFRK